MRPCLSRRHLLVDQHLDTKTHQPSSCSSTVLDQSVCAQSVLRFYIYQTMGAATIPAADCMYSASSKRANSTSPAASAHTPRVARDLDTAFDVTSDTLCGANAYGDDDGYRYVSVDCFSCLRLPASCSLRYSTHWSHPKCTRTMAHTCMRLIWIPRMSAISDLCITAVHALHIRIPPTLRTTLIEIDVHRCA